MFDSHDTVKQAETLLLASFEELHKVSQDVQEVCNALPEAYRERLVAVFENKDPAAGPIGIVPRIMAAAAILEKRASEAAEQTMRLSTKIAETESRALLSIVIAEEVRKAMARELSGLREQIVSEVRNAVSN